MLNLIVLKNSVLTILERLREDTREDIKVIISNLFVSPLVNFNDAYDYFAGSLGQSASASDRWRTIQVDLITEVGDGWPQLFDEFKSVYGQVMKDSPGGEIFIRHKTDWDRLSFTIALAIRIYGDTLYITEEAPKGGKQ